VNIPYRINTSTISVQVSTYNLVTVQQGRRPNEIRIPATQRALGVFALTHTDGELEDFSALPAVPKLAPKSLTIIVNIAR
jgi:hypothetical protein